MDNNHQTHGAAITRLLRHAEAVVRSGRRPTVDVLVAECGGSRTTAQNALTAFWSDTLPRLLAARAIEDTDMPTPVLDAVQRLWGEAQEIATEAAQASVQADRDAARVAMATADARVAQAQADVQEAERRFRDVSEQLVATKTAAAETTATLTAQVQSLYSTLDAVRSDLATTQAALAAAEAKVAQMSEQIIDAKETIGHLERDAIKRDAAHCAEITALREDHQREQADHAASVEREIAAIHAAHANAFSELRAARLDAEHRMMIDLDAAKTQARQYLKQMEVLKARYAHAVQRLEQLERKRRSTKKDNPGQSRG